MNILALRQFPMLLKREFWEYRVMFLYLPALLTALSVSVLILGSALMRSGVVEVTVGSGEDFRVQRQENNPASSLLDLFGARLLSLADSSFTYREQVLNDLYFGSSSILFTTLWFVMFYYLLNCLYQDRKDRSILFWKSLPVSDWLTVISKMVTGLLLLPLIYLLFIMLSNVSLLLISTAVSMGQSIDIWDTLWAPAHLLSRWLDMMGYILFSLVWCLPFSGWLLLVSSWAKSVPLVWVVGIPLFALLMEQIFTSSDSLSEFIGTHMMARFSTDLAVTSNIFSIDLLAALIIGSGFVAGAIWRRGYADEI
jgi:ABC-2 type transport system permease protein